ncbi:NUDIX hydrolase [Patescibacteria group bacterium AH-259-L07]|nr:NUDIX hydrolase [Patescibacteria group bacterium AH-259-L07]
MKHEHTFDEYIDIVDEHDNVIGKKKRSEIYAKNLSNFRVVDAFIINSKKEIWIPRRTINKRIFPLCLDTSMGGHVETGETYESAFKREMNEELNIDIEKTPYRFLGYLTPHKHGVSAFTKVYEIKMGSAPNYNKNDYVEYFWLTPKKLFQRIKNGDKARGDLPKLVKFFYGA